MEAIILSGPPAAGKTTVAHILSEMLGMTVIGGGDILKEMATEQGYRVTGQEWWDTPEGLEFHAKRENNLDFDREVDVRLIEKIERGNIIVTSYTAPWLTRKGFKVWLDGTPENRAIRMSKRDSVPIEESRHAMRLREEENSRIYKTLYNINFGVDMRPFDIVIDTNKKTPMEVAGIIIKKYNDKYKDGE